MRAYEVHITVRHVIKIIAANKADALNEAENEVWDDHIKEVIIDVEEINHTNNN